MEDYLYTNYNAHPGLQQAGPEEQRNYYDHNHPQQSLPHISAHRSLQQVRPEEQRNYYDHPQRSPPHSSAHRSLQQVRPEEQGEYDHGQQISTYGPQTHKRGPLFSNSSTQRYEIVTVARDSLPKKTIRGSYACNGCRASKVSCSRGTPCQTCLKKGVNCVYAEQRTDAWRSCVPACNQSKIN
ncbi:uncharacterized protein K489DRAFT_397240 [Dissoconium aciculare CBS 342.82]|uniref:Zn(2)-C6 fungal-type domain-containing protein n=1 Tax=Dissoconium aciculare CBS 342.82 TaxID=1314786 RepID=A0A6J3MGQ2_9PEZI|nr:uncharacterized protein K489DRAFT_397240 [Dissoconium aciculare CBS 342.82]KAF1826859.1 hypothetical protein K489DRAFT_397240 [Dissoconium aciculare CBS 342.82]